MSEQNPTLFTSPIKTLYYFTVVVGLFLKQVFQWLLRKWYLVLLLALIAFGPRYVPGPHQHYVTQSDDLLYFMAYWIILGVASSIGLGTGLHTFVLYLGPHMAKVTLFSYECNAIPLRLPSNYNIDHFECPSNPSGVSFLQILMSLQFEAFLWGFGTALGELPPYFVARAASLANKKQEELDQLKEAENKHSLVNRIKLIIYHQLQNHAFITVLLCASIPNPLFDLAGITCGHFLIPFATFFSATAIGKAIIKVHIQTLFVIFVFSKEHVESLVGFIERNIPYLQNSLTNMIEKQKQLLHDPKSFKETEKPLVGKLWDYFIIGMIAFFLISIINSLVAQHLENNRVESKDNQQGTKSKKGDSQSKKRTKKD